jgi:hypothetical protein
MMGKRATNVFWGCYLLFAKIARYPILPTLSKIVKVFKNNSYFRMPFSM